MCGVIHTQVGRSRDFRREGFDIHLDVSISFTQAALGGEIKIPGLSGPIMLKVRGYKGGALGIMLKVRG